MQSLAKINNFRNKKYIKLINGGGQGGPNKSGEGQIFFQKKLSGGWTFIRDLRVEWESDGKKALILWGKYEHQFPRSSPYDIFIAFLRAMES